MSVGKQDPTSHHRNQRGLEWEAKPENKWYAPIRARINEALASGVPFWFGLPDHWYKSLALQSTRWRRRESPMGRRIVGYVISHSGKPGGPWEDKELPMGTPAKEPAGRMVYVERDWAEDDIGDVRAIHPAARILRLVRRERHTAEERAVVEAAMAFDAAHSAYLENMDAHLDDSLLAASEQALAAYKGACAALRAKRGGK